LRSGQTLSDKHPQPMQPVRLSRSCIAGHVGGDDFVVLFQSGDWEARCTRIISHFNTAALTLFDQQRAAADSSKPKTDRATTPPSR
jgi:hypothetical protein